MDLSGGPDRVEVIGDDRDGGVGERLTLWLLDHRRQVRRVTAVVVAAAVVVGIAVVAGRWYLGRPRLPHLVAARSTADPRGVLDASWQTGDDGHPASPVRIKVQGEVTLRGLPTATAARTEVLGLTGPGLDGALPIPVTVPGEGVPTAVDGDLEIDCDAVPLPVPVNGYGVRVRVTDGGSRADGVLPAGGLSTWLAGAIGQGCGSWLAKRDVEVTDAVATPDPREPHATVAVTVTNRGRHAVRLLPLGDSGFQATLGGGTAAGVGDAEQAVPAGATSVIRTQLTIGSCTEVLPTLQPDSAGQNNPTTAERLGLVGTAAPAGMPGTPSNDLHLYGDGVGPTGLVMSARATARVDDVKATLCGRLAPPDVSVDGSRARWNPARHELSLPLRLTVRGGQVRSAALGDTSQVVENLSLTNAPSAPFAVGGRGGDLSLTLTYRVTGVLACDQDGILNLGYIEVQVSVATPSGLRRVPLGITLQGPSMPAAPPGVCG